MFGEREFKSRRGLVALAAITVVALCMGAAGAAVTSGATTFKDTEGDAAGGLDITAVTVRNDDLGVITIQVPGPASVDPFGLYSIFVDVDRTPASPDYALLTQAGLVRALRFTLTGNEAVTLPSLEGTYRSGPTISVDRKDLAVDSTFRLRVESVHSSLDPATAPVIDGAPDDPSAWWSYVLRVPLTLGRAQVTPSRVTSGRPLTIQVPVTRIGDPVARAAVRCDANIGSLRLARTASRLIQSTAVCSWKVPQWQKGKIVTGRIQVGSNPFGRAEHRFSLRVVA